MSFFIIVIGCGVLFLAAVVGVIYYIATSGKDKK